MEKKLSNALSDVISTITKSQDFKDCIAIKEKMSTNKELVELIEKVKKLQQKYVKTNDCKVKEELDVLEKQLESIPIYDSYLKKLEKVNQSIETIKDELNDYFYNVVNQK